MKIELHDPVGVFFREIEDRRISQASIAITYAFIMAQLGSSADYGSINRAIMDRWKGKTALARIKEAAWKHLERRSEPEIAG